MSDTTNGTAMAVRDEQPRAIASIDLTAIERVIVAGDLSKLTPSERWNYYQDLCRSVGLNPFTQPFAYMTLSGKMVLYALKGAAEQLRRIYGVSVAQPSIQIMDGLVSVTVTATDRTGRTDADMGLVNIEGLKGEARANAIMKAVTKAKRRVTLSMCGLGMLDETEVETIPNARVVDLDQAHGALPTPAKVPAEEESQDEWDGFDRGLYERRYLSLVEIATRANHPHAAKAKAKQPADLPNALLLGSVQTMRGWYPDVTDEMLDAEQGQ